MQYATAQSLVSTVPLISFAIVFGSPYALSSIAGGIASVAASSQLGSSMVDGSVAMKQTSYNNATKNQQQLAPTLSMGAIVDDGMVRQTTSQDGEYTSVAEQQDQLATNHVSTDGDSASISQSLSGAKSQLASLTEREGKVTTLAKSQGMDWLKSIANGTVTANNMATTEVDTLKTMFGTSESTSSGTTSSNNKSTGTSAHAGVSTPSAITAVTGVSGGASVTAANTEDFRKELSEQDRQSYDTILDHANTAAKTGSFTTNNSTDQKLGESYGANLQEQEQIATDKAKTQQDVKTYTQQNSYVESNSGTITKNLNDAYFKETMARHPELSNKQQVLRWEKTHQEEAAAIGRDVSFSHNSFDTPEYKAYVARMDKNTPSVENTQIATPGSLKTEYKNSATNIENKAVVTDATGATKPIKEVVSNAAKSSNLGYNKDTREMLKNNLNSEEKIAMEKLQKERLGVKGTGAFETKEGLKEKEAKLQGITGDSAVARVLDKIGNDTSDTLGMAKVGDKKNKGKQNN